MRIFIDGDSFVKSAQEVVVRGALKGYFCAHFVANHPLALPKKGKNIFFYHVDKGADVADDFIVKYAQAGELVLTRDIILANRLLHNEVLVINDRGYQFNLNEIGVKLSERVIMLKAREAGLYITPQDSTYTKKDLEKFANCLYNIINKREGLRESYECAMIEMS